MCAITSTIHLHNTSSCKTETPFYLIFPSLQLLATTMLLSDPLVFTTHVLISQIRGLIHFVSFCDWIISRNILQGSSTL
jgi:hypothetical protein